MHDEMTREDTQRLLSMLGRQLSAGAGFRCNFCSRTPDAALVPVHKKTTKAKRKVIIDPIARAPTMAPSPSASPRDRTAVPTHANKSELSELPRLKLERVVSPLLCCWTKITEWKAMEKVK